MEKILVTGGCGFIGTNLIPALLKSNYKVLSIDTQYFGNFLSKHKNLTNLKISVKDLNNSHLKKVKYVIHLAAISNDPAALLDSKITWETNVLNTYHLLELCKKNKIKKFLFASSGSVYGVSKNKKVTESTNLLPISDYNKTKMIGEKIVERYKKHFDTIILRPGTVCGFSKALRLDLTVNAMTYDSIIKKKIVVNGGSQIRPQLHIDDMVNAYIFFLKKKKVGIYNIGFENFSINKISKIIKQNNKNCKIVKNRLNDIRSYRLNSDKLLKIGFKPNKNSFFAIKELIQIFKKKKKFNENSYRTKKLKKIFSRKQIAKFF